MGLVRLWLLSTACHHNTLSSLVYHTCRRARRDHDGRAAAASAQTSPVTCNLFSAFYIKPADERDEIMTDALLRLEGRVVGVVGLAHLDGIERRWEQLQASGRALTAG